MKANGHEVSRDAMRAFVISPFDSNAAAPEADRRLEEAIGLAEAIDLVVASSRSVKLSRIRPATYFGSGFTESQAKLVKDLKVGLVIVDAALSPVQQRNLELAWHCKVLDRAALIIEIFGARARTHEGRLQVELAALRYQRSRLVRSWTHLERQRGGYGFLGGPGEGQLEIDRRLTDQRISKLETEIDGVRRTRLLHRKSRRNRAYPTLALVGYTNAGKSTLFNRLTGAAVMAKDMLFATLDPTMRAIELPSGETAILCDTVGFITDLPTELVAAFRATLEEVTEADLIIHVQDMTAVDLADQKRTVLEIIESIIEDAAIEIIDVLNKADLVEKDVNFDFGHGGNNNPPAVQISALSGQGCEVLLERLDKRLNADRRPISYRVPSENGAALAWLHSHGKVLKNLAEEREMLIEVVLSPSNVGRFARRFDLQPEEIALSH